MFYLRILYPNKINSLVDIICEIIFFRIKQIAIESYIYINIEIPIMTVGYILCRIRKQIKTGDKTSTDNY